MNEYMKLLGMKAKDVVSGFEGVVTTVSFDLYGCIQIILSPPTDKDGKKHDGYWFDAKRLVVIGDAPVMAPPNFAAIPAGKEIGPAEKPAMSSRA